MANELAKSSSPSPNPAPSPGFTSLRAKVDSGKSLTDAELFSLGNTAEEIDLYNEEVDRYNKSVGRFNKRR